MALVFCTTSLYSQDSEFGISDFLEDDLDSKQEESTKKETPPKKEPTLQKKPEPRPSPKVIPDQAPPQELSDQPDHADDLPAPSDPSDLQDPNDQSDLPVPSDPDNLDSSNDKNDSEEPDDFDDPDDSDDSETSSSTGLVRTDEDRPDTRFIIISGSIGVYFLFRDDFFADAVQGNNTTNLDQDFFDPRLSLRLDIQVKNNIRGVIEIQNEQRDNILLRSSLGNHFISGRSAEDRFQIEIERGYIEVDNFLVKGFTFRAGIIPHKYSLRFDGQSFFLNLGESESPFATRADTHAIGVNTIFQPIEQLELYLDAFYFVTSESDFGRRDETVAGLNIDFFFSKSVQDSDEETITLPRFFNLIFAAIQGDSNTPIWTLGAGIDYTLTSDPDSYTLELYGEVLFQFGEYDRRNLPPAFTVKDQDHLALGGYAGFRMQYRGSPWQPYLDASYWYISGDDDDPTSDRNRDLVTFENIDSTLILEDNDYGLDVDSNYWAIKIKSGISLAPIFTDEDIRLEVLYGYFRTADAPSGRSRRLGEEIDIRFTWEYSSDLIFSVASGFLWNSRHFKNTFDELGARGRDHAFMFRAETSLRF